MKDCENCVCGECGYFSAVHPYKVGACLKQVTKNARKGSLEFKKVGVHDPACENFILYQRLRTPEGYK